MNVGRKKPALKDVHISVDGNDGKTSPNDELVEPFISFSFISISSSLSLSPRSTVGSELVRPAEIQVYQHCDFLGGRLYLLRVRCSIDLCFLSFPAVRQVLSTLSPSLRLNRQTFNSPKC